MWCLFDNAKRDTLGTPCPHVPSAFGGVSGGNPNPLSTPALSRKSPGGRDTFGTPRDTPSGHFRDRSGHPFGECRRGADFRSGQRVPFLSRDTGQDNPPFKGVVPLSPDPLGGKYG